jgi:pimeloyl-ACP methyl ester carboxylesterase
VRAISRELRSEEANLISAPGTLVDVGGSKLHLACAGEGSPTVVLEAALGASSVSWSLVQPEVARVTRVCSYDRAGFGWSEAGPQPRTARRIATELHVLLERAGIAPPYVLVGHSYGGVVARVFAHNYRTEVAGLVFVDPAHPEDWVRPAPKEQVKIDRGLRLCRSGAIASRLGIARAVAGLGSIGALTLARGVAHIVSRGDLKKEDEGILAPVWKLPVEIRRTLPRFWTQAKFFEALGSQIEFISKSSEEAIAAEADGYGDLPLVTISSTDPGDYRLRQQETLASLSTRGRHIIASHSGHWVPLDQPELVIQVIRDMVEEIRAGTSTNVKSLSTV